MAFWNRKSKEPKPIQLTIDPEKIADLQRQINAMTEAMNKASVTMQESAKAVNKAAAELKKTKPRSKITNY